MWGKKRNSKTLPQFFQISHHVTILCSLTPGPQINRVNILPWPISPVIEDASSWSSHPSWAAIDQHSKCYILRDDCISGLITNSWVQTADHHSMSGSSYIIPCNLAAYAFVTCPSYCGASHSPHQGQAHRLQGQKVWILSFSVVTHTRISGH